MPMRPPSLLINNPWIIATIAVKIKPPIVPNKNVPIRMGMSAGSYFIKGTAGNSGKLMSKTKTMDKAMSIAMPVSIRVLLVSIRFLLSDKFFLYRNKFYNIINYSVNEYLISMKGGKFMFNVKLNNQLEMPILGMGVYLVKDLAQMQEMVDNAIKAGYRSFDTAQMYKNEELLGQALHNAAIKREKLFLTTKIDLPNMSYDKVFTSFEESLGKLQTDYVDLLLVHWPGQNKTRLQEVWQAFEKLYIDKRVKAIGVCNCLTKHLEWILATAKIVPAVNQLEHHPLFNRQELGEFCFAHEIQPEAWAPLIRGKIELPEIMVLSQKYAKTPAQIILRWNVQSNWIVIPKSVNPKRIKENIDVFDFELSDDDMALINSLNTNYTTGWDLATFDFGIKKVVF